MLGKHFEKLMQCDPLLNFLSQQPEILLESPYFESKVPVYNEPDVFIHSKREEGSVSFDLQHAASPSGVQSSSSNIEQDLFNPSTSSEVVDSCVIGEISSSRAKEPNMLSQWDQIKIPGLHPSISMSDLVNHIRNCISERRTSGTSMISDDDLQEKDILEEITQYLLSDTPFTAASDEPSLLTRVNSLCCPLQHSTAAQNTQANNRGGVALHSDGNLGETNSSSASILESKVENEFCAPDGDPADVSGSKPPTAMSREDSVAELLHSLPRIASLPQFLFNISEASNEER